MDLKVWKQISKDYEIAKNCLWRHDKIKNWHRDEDKGFYHMWKAYYSALTQEEKELLEKKEDFYRGFTSKPRQMPIKSINSRKFNSIKNKYIKIIPKCSIIGRLFYDIDNPIICDAKAIGLLGHSVFTWVLEDKQFKRSELTKLSIDLDNNFTSWIESYSEDEIKYFCNYIFLLLDRFNFKMVYDLKNIDSNTYLEILKYIKNTDPKVKKMLEEFLSFIKAYYKDDIGKKISPIFSIYDKLRSKEI